MSDKGAKNLLKCVLKRGRPVDARKKDIILEAASALFLAKGFSGTSMDDVARKADMSKLTLYSRFESKEELFKAMIASKCDQYHVPTDYEEYYALPVDEALMRVGMRFRELVFSDMALRMHRIIETESVRDPKIGKLFYEAGPKPVKESFEAFLTELCRRKRLKIPDVPLARDHFLSLLKGEAHFKVIMGLAKPPAAAESEAHVRSCVAVFMKAYGP